MPKTKPPEKPSLSQSHYLFARLGLFIALGISMYLAWHSLRGGALPGCGPESDCDKVLGSKWGYVLGLPVSLFAGPIYAVLLVLLSFRPLQWRILSALAAVIVAAALWFTGIQMFVLRAFCKFCMTAHLAGVISAILLLRRNPLPARSALPWAGVGVAATALIVIAQITSAGPKPVVTTVTTGQSATSAVPVSVVTTNLPATEAPRFRIVGGEYELKLDEVPVHGSLDAPKKVAKLFDYTCHHCRDMHLHFKPLLAKYAGELAVISLPMPLDANCNFLMKRTPSAHINACEYARIGLAVFFADPKKSEEYDNWFFDFNHPPSLDQSRRLAEELVGKEPLEKALADPRVMKQIRQDVEIYAANSRIAGGRSQMPQLLFAHATSIGPVSSPHDLEMILTNTFATLPTPAPAGGTQR